MLESLHRQATHQTPDTVSAGYGEITRGGFQRILHYLQFEGNNLFYINLTPISSRASSDLFQFYFS